MSDTQRELEELAEQISQRGIQKAREIEERRRQLARKLEDQYRKLPNGEEAKRGPDTKSIYQPVNPDFSSDSIPPDVYINGVPMPGVIDAMFDHELDEHSTEERRGR